MSDLPTASSACVAPRPRPGPPATGSSGAFGLERLEREMLGESPPGDGEALSLKERLERLVAVAAVKEKERRRGPAPVPLEELVEGMRVENERGEFFLVETAVHLEVRHGDVPLSRVHAIEPSTVGDSHRGAGAAGLRPAPRGLPRHRDDRPRRRGGNRRLPDRRRLGGRRPLRRPPVLHAGLPRGGGAPPRAGGGAGALRPPGHLQRQDVRRAAPRHAVPPQPGALPALRGAAPRPAPPRAAALEGAARVLPPAVARGRR